ncbi:MAG: EamA/RhaT family transporter [Chitinophagaceae bacterium]|nr:EamA/RhaT family transporter [Chitinophagaceae bacterium]
MKSALIKLHVAVFLWGFTGVLGRLISLDAFMLVWYRMLITVLTLFFLMFLRKELQRIPLQKVLQLIGIGALVAGHWITFYGSIKIANVSIALTCLSSAGLFTAFLEPLFFRRRINTVEILLGLIAIAGIYLIFHFDSQYRLGIIIGIISTLLSVLFSLMNKKLVSNIPPKTMMLYELSGGWLVLTLVLPVFLQYFPPKQFVPGTADWGWLLLLSWLCTVLAMDLSLQALKKITAFTQNLTLNLEPVYGIILAFIVYHENENLSAGFYAGFSLIILAVVLQTMLVVYKTKRFVVVE